MTNLKELHISKNQLTELSSEIKRLDKLGSLYLYSNQLTGLLSEIGQLTSLVSLILDDNQITELPSTIGQLINLRTIYLTNNELVDLPVEIILSSNPIRFLPKSIDSQEGEEYYSGYVKLPRWIQDVELQI